MPFFVVLDVRPRIYDSSKSGFDTAMRVVAGVMVLLGLLFYLVFIRGERREAARMEEHRRRLRKRMRERAEAAANGELPPSDAIEAPDGSQSSEPFAGE